MNMLLLVLSFPPAFLTVSGDGAKILLAIFVILAAAKLLAEIFERLRQPAVAGEILAGILIGPSLLHLIQPYDETGAATTVGLVVEALAEIGVIFLLFTVGLETRPSDFMRVGRKATFVAVMGVLLPFLAGWGLISLWGTHTRIEAVFVGAAMVATSVGITARVLSAMGLITAEASRIILAAAVIDDVIGLLVLAVVSSLAFGTVNYLHIALIAALAIGFTVFVMYVGAPAVRRVKQPVENLRTQQSLFIFALLLCFGLAVVASLIGIAGIIGAFLAGVALSEASDDTNLSEQAHTLTEFTTPFFLVNIGLKLNVSVFTWEIVLLAAVVTLLAIATKFVGCSLTVIKSGRRRAVQVGVGMIPRGEVGIVVAQIGLSLAAVSDAMYAVVLFMAVATTLAAPPLIQLAFRGEQPTDREIDQKEFEYDIR